jgi:hypothetical protein
MDMIALWGRLLGPYQVCKQNGKEICATQNSRIYCETSMDLNLSVVAVKVESEYPAICRISKFDVTFML